MGLAWVHTQVAGKMLVLLCITKNTNIIEFEFDLIWMCFILGTKTYKYITVSQQLSNCYNFVYISIKK